MSLRFWAYICFHKNRLEILSLYLWFTTRCSFFANCLRTALNVKQSVVVYCICMSLNAETSHRLVVLRITITIAAHVVNIVVNMISIYYCAFVCIINWRMPSQQLSLLVPLVIYTICGALILRDFVMWESVSTVLTNACSKPEGNNCWCIVPKFNISNKYLRGLINARTCHGTVYRMPWQLSQSFHTFSENNKNYTLAS